MITIGTISSSDKSVPDAPTVGTATNVGSGRAFNNGRGDVTFTAPTYTGRLPITGYTVTSNPGGFTGTGSASPITVTGLQSSTAYTFTVTGTNSVGTSAASAASNSITATTVPQAPTIGTATDGGTGTTVSVAFTGNATGGSAITGYTATSSPGGLTGTGASSPITVSGLTAGTAYTFTVTATNANGTSAASAASNSVTPTVPSSYDSIASVAPDNVAIITISSIPSTYKHLELHIGFKDTTGTEDTMTAKFLGVRFNGDTGSSNYYTQNWWINGNTGGGGTVTSQYGNTSQVRILGGWKSNNGTGSNASRYAPSRVFITDYTNTSTGKSVIVQGDKNSNVQNDTNFGTAFGQGVWTGTAAINSVTIVANGTWSTSAQGLGWVNLYGIKE